MTYTVQTRTSAKPQLRFFCELNEVDFEALFSDSGLLTHLKELDAGVCIGLLDLGETRAMTLKKLVNADIPLTAWLLLPEEQGYWFNLNNAAEAVARYDAFLEWTARHQLRWEAIGLDVEFDMRDVKRITTDRFALLPLILRNLRGQGLEQAAHTYHQLVRRIQADGYLVESYIIPFVLDERRAAAKLLHRLAGLIDLPVDREIPMLYTSFLRAYGAGMLWSYIHEVGAAGIGSTGGGVSVAGADTIAPLSWEELARDLRLAASACQRLYVFSLEGCVRQNFLPRLSTFDWSTPVAIPSHEARQMARVRTTLYALLWGSANPLVVVAAGVGMILALRTLLRIRSQAQ